MSRTKPLSLRKRNREPYNPFADKKEYYYEQQSKIHQLENKDFTPSTNVPATTIAGKEKYEYSRDLYLQPESRSFYNRSGKRHLTIFNHYDIDQPSERYRYSSPQIRYNHNIPAYPPSTQNYQHPHYNPVSKISQVDQSYRGDQQQFVGAATGQTQTQNEGYSVRHNRHEGRQYEPELNRSGAHYGYVGYDQYY